MKFLVKMRRAAALGLVIGGTLAGAGGAEPLTGAAAAKALFAAEGNDVVFARDSGLAATDLALLQTLFKLDLAKVSPEILAASGVSRETFAAALAQFQSARYYGAVAVAPKLGVVSPATQMAQNLHSPEAARAAALAACKSSGGRDCVVAAEVLPKGYKPAAFTLNQDATAAFEGYRKSKTARAIAASAATPAFSEARGAGAEAAALDECNRLSGIGDCAVVVSDR